MACNWSSSSHVTTRQQNIIVKYTNCPHEHNHNVPHDCLYDLDTCGLFEPSGPNGSPESTVCAACHCHRNLHRRVMVHHEMAHSPPRPQAAARRETFTRPAPVSEPGPSATQRAKRLTIQQKQRLLAIEKRNNYRMFREYPKAEVEQICAELGIKQRILSDWISRHNLARKRDAAAREADARPAAANCCLCLKLAN